MTQDMPLISLDRTARPAIADLVYGELHKQVLNLDLKPGEKLSEAEIANGLKSPVNRCAMHSTGFRKWASC